MELQTDTSVTIKHLVTVTYEGDERPRLTITEGYGRSAKPRDVLVSEVNLGWEYGKPPYFMREVADREEEAWWETRYSAVCVRIRKDGSEGAEWKPYTGMKGSEALDALMRDLQAEHRPAFIPTVDLGA